jgi:replicative DNA helicase
MNKNIEKIDRYLKGVALPEHVSDQHRRQLRRQILNRTERRQTMSVKVRSWKYAAVVALICTGVVAAAVVGVKIYNYRVVGKDPESGYLLLSEDGTTMVNIPENHADSPEQAAQYAQEIALLSQQGDRELVIVGDTEVNGQHDSRSFTYNYTLSDGRTMYAGDPATQDGERSLTREQQKELISLLRADEYERLDTKEEEEVMGRVFVFTQQRFVLSDGTIVIKSVGTPK